MGNVISRRKILQMGLGAGAGLALWELYRLGLADRLARGPASRIAFEELGLGREELRRVLAAALERGGQYADVFLERSVSSYMGHDGERVQNAGVEAVSGAAVRVMADGRTAFRATGDLTLEGLMTAAREAGAAARSGVGARVGALSPLTLPDLYHVAAPALSEPMREKEEFLVRASAAAKSFDSRVHTARVGYRDTLRFITVANSDGVVASDTQPLIKVTVSVAAADAEKTKTGLGAFSGGGHYGLEYFQEHPPERLGRRAAEIARNQLEAVAAPSGELPVVLGPAYSGVLLHEAVGHGLEADFNAKNYSAYSGRVGEVVASPLCTIFDEGRRPSLNGSINFDDEGVASSKTLLIEGGRLAGYMHSRETAAKMNAAPTGNGRRQGFSFPPLPRMTNTYLAAGEASPEDVIRSVAFGVYARAFAGGSVNITTGDFTFVPTEAYLIEKGRVTAPLSNVLLLGNGPAVLNRVSMVGDDLEISDNLWECGKQGQMIPVTVGTPTVKVEALTVGGSLAPGGSFRQS